MPPRFISAGYTNDERQQATSNGKLFGRQRTIHQIFGGGKVADIVLWRNKHLSGAILVGVTMTWFLFEVVEYHFLTLLCHLLIAAMLLIFIWSNGAALLDRSPLHITEIILSERTFKEFAIYFHARLSHFLVIFQYVAMGSDLRLFLLAITSLWMISVVGSFFNSLNLLYLGYLCIQILPALYEHYEREVDHLALMGSHDIKNLFNRFDINVLNKIPRGPIKEKKYR